ncbi:MAG: hypothetical protein K2H86_06540 [Muribaculaceae bacterium]|nr:hypothetical protein [Muribaculaceae bacterium]
MLNKLLLAVFSLWCDAVRIYRQRAYESLGAGNRCVYNYDEEDKDAKILDIFYQSFC